ncbi:MAG: DNA polymerase III subunit gamma/tau [Clostridia bacterium]|nr:DNA polymerase III subunit gamma/tau [Clostridia bacterium]
MSEYKALYRKWRPFDFDDVCGQRAVTDILKYEVASDKISHAYLFCGSRGTGKTSCAKILAKAVNCLDPQNGNPCNKCEACRSIDQGIATDVIEMDAASNNGVGDVRDLKDEINFTPAMLKYRVYIIDEVHMMSGAAFNALLKTLEEPPSYVVFILATTEFNKLPTTIVSRCQRFDFRRISSEIIIDRLNKISSVEGIDLAPDGARLIARAARGGMRDAVSLLELCAGSRARIDAALVASTIGTGDRNTVYKLMQAVGAADYNTVYSVIRDVVLGSGDISVFWQEIIDSYRDVMVIKNSDKARSYLDLTDIEYETLSAIAASFTMPRLSYHTTLLEAALADMQRAINSKRSIAEIALTRMCDAKLVVSAEALAVRVEELEKQISMMQLGVTKQPKSVAQAGESVNVIAPAPKKAQESKGEPFGSEKQLYKKWHTVLEQIGELKRSLYSQFNGSVAYVVGESEFVVEMNEFFAYRLVAGSPDYTILKGLIAKAEGKDASSIGVKVLPLPKKTADDVTSDLENIFN